MKKTIKALKGMPDILPDEIYKWQYVEDAARELFHQYGYEEIRTPILEETALFKRSIGEETDIVQKQMYTFKDRGERILSLRPEGTASVIRAYLENGLGKKSSLYKLYYIGPMFRSERPQAGRNRQFYQIGVEAIGTPSPYLDAEIVSLMMRLLEISGLSDGELKINSLGCAKDKKAFEEIMRKNLARQIARLCKDCVRRYKKNILRVFDCKNESCRQMLRTMPKINDSLCPSCSAHFNKVRSALDSIGIKYLLTPMLVRGLDYYTGAVFEVTHKNLGSQDAVAAGGRYDNLVEEMGGDPTPACGFAIGLDRLLLALKDKSPQKQKEDKADIFLIGLGEEAQKKGFVLLNELRNKGVSCQMGFDEKSLKSQMRFADKIKARKVLIIGEEELRKECAILRDMEKKEQKEIRIKDVANAHMW